MSKRRPNRSRAISLEPNVRYSVLHPKFQEIYSANHRSIGEAFNSRDEDYVPTTGIIIVATLDDVIIGEINRDGTLKKIQPPNLPKTIWSGFQHPFFDPQFKNND
jgi:hypothetical protein